MTIKKKIFILLFFIKVTVVQASQPFYFAGDGHLSLQDSKTSQRLNVTYADENTLSPSALVKINKLFGIKAGQKTESVSPRLIALLDYLQDHYQQGQITIVSGFRSSEYNEGLRKKGKQAAMTSLHIEGMAADINIEGVAGRDLWMFVRGLGCCGAGYYFGKGIHIDTGPVRFWDQNTTKVKDKLGARNKLILADTDQDIYLAHNTVKIGLGRITDYPVSIHKKVLIRKENRTVGEAFITHEAEDCLSLYNRDQAKNLSLVFSEKTKPFEKAHLEISFCEKPFPEMKDFIPSNPISLRK